MSTKSKKADKPQDAPRLVDLPSVGIKTAKYLGIVNIRKPEDLLGKDPYELYVQLCEAEQKYYDPCLLDQFISAVEFMNNGKKQAWWKYTDARKEKFPLIAGQVQCYRKPARD